MKKSMDVSIIILVLTCLAALAAFFASREGSKQQTRIEDLGNINRDLGQKIQTLSALNHNISTETEKIVGQNTILSKENIKLTAKSKDLILKVQTLLKSLDVKTDQEFAVSGSFDFPVNEINSFQIEVGGNRSIIHDLHTTKDIFVGISVPLVNKIYFRIVNNQLLVTTKIFDYFGNLIAEIYDSKWRVNKNFVSKFNFDKKGFEIFNNQGNLSLSMDIEDNNLISIQGILIDRSLDAIMVINKHGLIGEPIEKFPSEEMIKFLQAHPFKQLFEYSGDHWHGIRKTNR